MSVFSSGDLLEEIVETTEEQEAEFGSSGETVDECTGLPLDGLDGDYIEEIDQKPVLVQHHLQQQQTAAAVATISTGSATPSRQHKSSRSSSSSGSHHHHHNSNNNTHNDHQSGTVNGNSSSGSSGSSGGRASSRNHMEHEKRMRREIANSNERRRMQSINAGFQSLRTLLPHHEGEKLSKAAILQQTAEYIYQLEQQKTQLLSQNLQLKRLVEEHEGGEVPTKKRKGECQGVVMSLPVHISESGDEGLGSMSPEPLSVITASATEAGHGVAGATSNEVAELKRQLERERLTRTHLEKQMRSLQDQLFPERAFREEQIIAYQPHEVIEHTNNVLPQELDDDMPGLQVVSVVSVPTVGSTQTVETSNADSNTPPLSPQPGCELVVPSDGGTVTLCTDDGAKEISVNDLLSMDSQPSSPKIVAFPVFSGGLDEQASSGSFSPGGGSGSVAYAPVLPAVNAAIAAEFKNSSSGQFITASPTRSFTPDQESSQPSPQQQQRLPSVLEAAIKAEPKVEVERLPSPSNSLDDGTAQTRLCYLANTSRQNLETIVEAIRHLEGDHLFSDEPAQDAPLALTNKPTVVGPISKQRLLQAEVTNFLQFHATQQQQQPSTTPAVAITAPTASTSSQQQQQQQTQQRPGVIVVKHS